MTMIRKALLAVLMASAFVAPALAADGPLKIVSIDVEGGGDTLFVTSEGKSLLIDTGWPDRAGLLPSLRTAPTASRRRPRSWIFQRSIM
jgi:beta-lactamase superfamily II metal-dependent hydrolase